MSARIYKERDAEIVRLRELGRTLAEIGDLYGISAERVRQILQQEEDRAREEDRRLLRDSIFHA